MHTSGDILPGRLLILSHPEFISISPRDISSGLPDAYKVLPNQILELNTEESLRPPRAARGWCVEFGDAFLEKRALSRGSQELLIMGLQ